MGAAINLVATCIFLLEESNITTDFFCRVQYGYWPFEYLIDPKFICNDFFLAGYCFSYISEQEFT